MTLREMSYQYQKSAERLSRRLKNLRDAERRTQDPVLKERLRRRIKELTPLLQEARELTRLTRHYYDRRYRRDDKYTL